MPRTRSPPNTCRAPGPLREALTLELAYRSVAEEKATRALSYYVAHAPGIPEMEFYATQLIDEARHARVFPPAPGRVGRTGAGPGRDHRRMSGSTCQGARAGSRTSRCGSCATRATSFGGVAIFTIVVEGVLAPAAELQRAQWDRLDPAASEIARGWAIDEIRHLTVGSSIIRAHLREQPGYRARLMEILAAQPRPCATRSTRTYVCTCGSSSRTPGGQSRAVADYRSGVPHP